MTITETLVEDVTVGMRRMYNEGRTSTITNIERESPRSQWVRISYRSDTATVKADGGIRHNVSTMRAKRGSYLPIVDGPAVHVGCVHYGVDRNIDCEEC